MSGTIPDDAAKHASINLKEYAAHSDWKVDPIIGFDQRAYLVIAQWVLFIFGGVYFLAFLVLFVLVFKADATFEKGLEMVRFMIQSLLPLVTLAVGYYLGDRNRQHQATGPARKR